MQLMLRRQNFKRMDKPARRPFIMRDTRRLMRDGPRRRRDASTAPPNSGGNQISPSQAMSQFGWIGPAISVMGNTARWAYSLNPDNDVIAALNMPLETLQTTPGSLLNACEIAVAGAAGKTYTAQAWPATAAAVTLTLTANTTNAFGVFVRISNSTLNFKYGQYEIQFCTGTTVLSSVVVQITSLPAEFVILGINNAAGKATIIGNTSPAVIFPYSVSAGATGNLNAGSFATGDVMYAETLNMRDIGNIVDATENGAILL